MRSADDVVAIKGHSTKVGEALDGKSIYGKWGDTGALPLLDACSAHFGATPDSTSEIYHYHVQDAPPFVVGCFGPNDDESLVTVAQCREFYTGCGDGDEQSFTTAEGTFKYDMWSVYPRHRIFFFFYFFSLQC